MVYHTDYRNCNDNAEVWDSLVQDDNGQGRLSVNWLKNPANKCFCNVDPQLRSVSREFKFAALDPRPCVTSPCLNPAYWVKPINDGWFDTTATYVGAFNANDLWCNGWTNRRWVASLAICPRSRKTVSSLQSPTLTSRTRSTIRPCTRPMQRLCLMAMISRPPCFLFSSPTTVPWLVAEPGLRSRAFRLQRLLRFPPIVLLINSTIILVSIRFRALSTFPTVECLPARHVLKLPTKVG